MTWRYKMRLIFLHSMLKSRDVFSKRCHGEQYYQRLQYRHQEERNKEMIVRERVLESILAARISSNPDLAKELGIELSTENENWGRLNLENIKENQSVTSSTEAYE